MRRGDDGEAHPNLILLDAYKEKLEFPELKKMALEKYREYEPDQLVVEKKASGAPLIFELRAMGLPVTEFVPSRGNDKIARVNAISDLFQSGFVWAPQYRWADEVIEECASFPSGEHDDYVDSTSQALIRFRQGGWIRTSLDDYDDDVSQPVPAEPYY
jgi:predicted phage terminase large subunit-like protein